MKTLCQVGLILFVAAVAWSQTDRGTIRGIVADPSGAVIPAAVVLATNVDTNVTSRTVVSEAGIYSLTALPAGNYRVQAEHPGFKSLVRSNIVVNVGTVTGIDLAMQLGDAAQTITVDEAAPILRTEQGSSTTEVSAQQFLELPLSSGGARSSQGFNKLVPGVNGTTVNGGINFATEIQVDGITTQTAELFGDNRLIRFPPDAVQELSMVTTAYAAEYGTTASGVQRYGIKSGTNTLHASGYEFWKNEALDARGFFNNVRPFDRNNQYGFTVGGPVWIPKVYNGKNKTFFFVSGDWYRQKGAGGTTNISLPNEAFRSGNLTGNPQLIYDPATTRVVGTNTVRDLFPNQTIPVNRMSKAALNILALVPHSTTQDLFNNTNATNGPSFTDYSNYTVKGDQYFGSNHHVSITELYTQNPKLEVSVLPDPLGAGRYGDFPVHMPRADWDWTISPTMLNQLRLGYNRQQNTNQTLDRDSDWPRKLGIPGYTATPGFFPITAWGFQALATNHLINAPVSNTYVLSDALSWTKNRHNLKFGVEYRDIRHSTKREAGATLNFAAGQTALPTALGTTGSAYASFLLGAVGSSNLSIWGPASPNNYNKSVDLYAQDDYKITPRLVVNYGLRFTLMTPMIEEHDRYSVMDLKTPNPAAGGIRGAYIFAGRNGQGSTLGYGSSNATGWGPRLGVAYRPFGPDRVVVRSGYGISYIPSGVYAGGNNTFLVEGFSADSSAPAPNQWDPAFSLDQGFPASRLQLPPIIDPGLNYKQGAKAWMPTADRLGYQQSWNFTVQTKLAANVALETAYVGSKGTNLGVYANTNQLNPAYIGLGSAVLNSNINSAQAVAAGIKSPYPGFAADWGAQATVLQALRPYPQYTGVADNNSNSIGNSTYHALQLKLDKRYSNGLYILAAYTWAKSISNSNSSNEAVGNQTQVRDQYNLALSKGLAAAYNPHIFTTAFIYALPFGPGKPIANVGGVLGKVIGGWQINGILTYRSGNSIGVTAPQTIPTYSANTADQVLGQPLKAAWTGKFDPATNVYLNAAAFAIPKNYTLGTTSQRLPNLRTFANYNEDLSLAKKVRIRERLGMEWRVESFNTFNRVVFGAPAAGINNLLTFGKITGQANSPRQAQLVMKLEW